MNNNNNNDRQQMNGNGQTFSPLRGVGGAEVGASFRHVLVPAGADFSAGGADCNHLLFMMGGCMAVSCNEFSGRTVSAGEFVLIPVAADTACTVLADAEAVVFSFARPDLGDAAYLRELTRINKGRAYDFSPLPMREPLGRFLTNFLALVDGGIDINLLSPLKAVELFLLLEAVYTPREVAALLYPLTGANLPLRVKHRRSFKKLKIKN